MITFSQVGNFGRLGNQLFQIAATLGAGRLNGEKAVFGPWGYADRSVNPIDQSLNAAEIRNVYAEPHFHYARIPHMRDMDLSGYFQSEKYFEHCPDLIRSKFQFWSWVRKVFVGKGKCAIHVRRGDYLNLKQYHTNLDMDYYNRSIKYMEEHVDGVKFIVVSDDIPWCKDAFAGRGFEFSEGGDEVDDMVLMEMCDHHIIANSSFSWWGAWLSKNPDKLTIAPREWFGPANQKANTKDLYCAGWIKM